MSRAPNVVNNRDDVEATAQPMPGHYRRMRRRAPPLQLDELGEVIHPSAIRHPNRVRVRAPRPSPAIDPPTDR